MNLFRKVLASIDLGDEASAKNVLDAALEVIEPGDTLHVISVVPDYGMSVVGTFFPADHETKALAKAKQVLHAFTEGHISADVPIQHIVGHGTIYEEVVATADKIGADIIVIGSHRPSLRDYLLGPNAEKVVRHAKQSVLVVRSK